MIFGNGPAVFWMKIMANDTLISFKLLLQKMEADIGLHELSAVETNVFLAISDLCNNHESSIAKTQDLLKHDLVSKAGRATVFRALTKLEAANKISKSDTLHGHYTLAS